MKDLEISVDNDQPTMTSLQLLEVINAEREAAGEGRLRNRVFVGRIEDELKGEILGAKFLRREGQRGADQKYYDLTRDQSLIMGMRESKYVRRNVMNRLVKKESLPSKTQTATLPAWTDRPRIGVVSLLRTVGMKTPYKIPTYISSAIWASDAPGLPTQWTDDGAYDSRPGKTEVYYVTVRLAHQLLTTFVNSNRNYNPAKLEEAYQFVEDEAGREEKRIRLLAESNGSKGLSIRQES